MIKHKVQDKDLRRAYRKTIELGLIGSLVIHIAAFRLVPDFDMTRVQQNDKDIIISVADIPPTEQIERKPAPARPSVPIPTESEEVPEDLTIESTELDLSEIPPPPEPNLEESYEEYQFIPYDEPPMPIGGFAAIQANLVYPQIAAKSGIEGAVVVGILIDEKGNPVKAQILKGSGMELGFEEAAIKAVMSIHWKPAKQRDTPVKVWVSIPVRFRLSSGAAT